MPSAQIIISRRRALFSAAALALLGATAACGSKPPPPELAGLTAQLDRAHADSKLATDAAAAMPPQAPQTRTMTAVATERGAHAQALSDELVRMTGDPAESFSAPSPTATSSAPAPPPAVRDVVNALKESAQSATDLAAKLSGYRAGLLGSIAASCTAAYSVALGGAR